jgi:ribose transport system ATP-binding protein
MLKVSNLSKTFPGVKALSEVNMQFSAGRVTAIMGENGAGKSTLLNILSGIYTDFEGTISLQDKELKFEDVNDSKVAGISIIHQELLLVPELSIMENLFLGKETENAWGILDKVHMKLKTNELLHLVGLNKRADCKISALKIGEQQQVEIAKALLNDSQVVCMDEPTAALSEQEVQHLFGIIEKLRKQGKIVIYISHKMKEVFHIADDFEVLRDGQNAGKGMVSETTENQLIKMMAGREVAIREKRTKNTSTKPLLTVNNLNLKQRGRNLADINFELFSGEIVGIFGLMGAGRTELMQSLFGLHYESLTAEIQINGETLNLKKPQDAIAKNIAFLTEDRKSEGLVLGMDIAENISLTTLKNWGITSDKEDEVKAQKYVKSLAIKTPDTKEKCCNLSGGNQQKVVLAKWLSTKPKVVLLDEPTRGIDINAKNEIYNLIESLASDGMGVLVASSEIPELLNLADRIIVMCEGKITANFTAEEANEEKLLKAALPV